MAVLYMADDLPQPKEPSAKSTHAEREERILSFWKEKGIFQKSLNKWPAGKAPKGEFVFYEGPPGANGRPHIGHFEARAFKDAIPRYKTMRGFHVRRKGGWDTHGLPVELQAEKELGIKSKKEIESFGIEAFNQKCQDLVWTHVHEWESMTERMGYWIDLKDPYVTYKPDYIEALWGIVKKVDEQKLLYKDYKVVPWCPRCGTALSSHELAQGYEDVKDLAVTVKFKVKNTQRIGGLGNNTYLLAWTTTPWTLPGNVGLAVNLEKSYRAYQTNPGEYLIAAVDRAEALGLKDPNPGHQYTGRNLVGLEYEPLYPFMPSNPAAFKVYAADFVTTDDGTGIVHIAPMYGQDDFKLGNEVGLPKHHLVNEDGTFKKEAGFLAGKFVKDPKTDVAIIKDLAGRGLLFAKEKYQHSYPFCWRCHTPLIYFARDSWYIKMSALRDELVAENEGIHWEPEHIREGRFGEWLREVKDWAISRERYWGTPLPVWVCEKCHARKTVGSVADVSKKPRNTYYVMRHGEAENNVEKIINCDPGAPLHLTEKGIADASETARSLKGIGFDLIISSPLVRTRETAEVVRKELGLKESDVLSDVRLSELGFGGRNGQDIASFLKDFPEGKLSNRFNPNSEGVETYGDLKKRVGDLLYELERKYDGKKILIISHGSPIMMLIAAARGLDREAAVDYEDIGYIHKATARPLDFTVLPHNAEYELDLHRPYIDEVRLPCACGGEMARVKEVMDVWFDSGAMPFAQDHLGLYPADFISEAIDQTRGWFYTLHAVGILMGKGKAYRNVICLGHVLDAEGKKMSKSVGNVVDPWTMMDKYGADALRFWMYSVNQPGDSKNFEEKTVDEAVKKVFNLTANVASFYKLYTNSTIKASVVSTNILDRWILTRLNELIWMVTTGLDKYKFFEPTRAIRDFIADLSQWYLRRSRDRFKSDGADKAIALMTTKHVLLTLAKVMAPFTPFFAEELYADAGGELESVHLENWPEMGTVDQKLSADMEAVRAIASVGLEARMAAKINVRQPLARLLVKDSAQEVLGAELFNLIKDEINVKEIVFDPTITSGFVLDTAITPELKEEGDLRELLRKIQDLRKEKGLSVGDPAILIVTNDLTSLVGKYEAQIKKATTLTAIEFGDELKLK